MSEVIYVINGPNLNLLGTREPGIYGSSTLKDIEEACRAIGAEISVDIEFFQSNHESVMLDFIRQAITHAQGIIINAAGFTHTSVAIHDALRMFKGPKIELHISNPHARESFRHISFVAPVVDGVIAGLGVGGYQLAVSAMADLIRARALPGSAE